MQSKSATTNANIGKHFKYSGKSEALLKQYKDLTLKVVSDNGAFANCESNDGRLFAQVPLFNCVEVRGI